MSQAENLVPIVPTSIEQVQQVQNDNIGTITGTAIGTASLKALAIKQIQQQKQVQPQVQGQVQPLSLCTYPEAVTGTASRPDSDTPTPEQLAHARRMLVACPLQGRPLHCWYCSRCSESVGCSAWHSRRQDVEFFRQVGKPYSLDLVESEAVEVVQ